MRSEQTSRRLDVRAARLEDLDVLRAIVGLVAERRMAAVLELEQLAPAAVAPEKLPDLARSASLASLATMAWV